MGLARRGGQCQQPGHKLRDQRPTSLSDSRRTANRQFARGPWSSLIAFIVIRGVTVRRHVGSTFVCGRLFTGGLIASPPPTLK